jgi:C4-dicarboxylate transporter DctQ subunit
VARRAFPILEPSRYGWTLEFCLALWVWIVFWGAAFVVRERDHVTFDVIYGHVSPRARPLVRHHRRCRRLCAALLWSVEPTWSKFIILRLKKTATLNGLFGDWIRMRDIYSIYILFLVVVAARYAGARSAPFATAPMPTCTGHDEAAKP